MDKITAIAEKLSNDWWAPRAAYEKLSGDLAPTGVEEAYAAQTAVQAKLSEKRGRFAGRKIALSSKAMQQMVGIDQPVAGAFFANDVRTSPAAIQLSNFRHMGLECELAIELNRDVSPSETAFTAETASALIANVKPAFELIEDKDADYGDLDVRTLIADNAWCGGVVLGAEIAGWRDLDLGNIASEVHQTGVEPEAANTGAADPLGSLAWVLNHFAGRGVTLRKGEHIITGSAVRTRFPAAGDKISYAAAGAVVEIDVV
ncbi:MAG: hypothetical protein GY948_20160 [Alphaproteobacteria bacterium]|nr:hypothetical protein [Alphaproteobacteria bacterium]